ncbi:MAG: hypothetical protein ABI440_05690 [Casimicrobiaceae bacterium]
MNHAARKWHNRSDASGDALRAGLLQVDSIVALTALSLLQPLSSRMQLGGSAAH